MLKKDLIYKILKCPKDVVIPTNDINAWGHFPEFNWIYNKLEVCKTQNIECAPIGITPPIFPVILKPIINLYGMGWGCYIVNNKDEYHKKSSFPGYFWMPLFKGRHLSFDFVLANGKIEWYGCLEGYPSTNGMFDYWESLPDENIPIFLSEWIAKYLTNYTGCLNIEIIDDKIIDCHLRMGDINQFHSLDLFRNIIKVYQKQPWDLDFKVPKIYLIPVFVNYTVSSLTNLLISYKINFKEAKKICEDIDPESKIIFTCQIDPHQNDSHNPTGGVRIANLNTNSLETGLMVRKQILEFVNKKKYNKRRLILIYISIIIYILITFSVGQQTN